MATEHLDNGIIAARIDEQEGDRPVSIVLKSSDNNPNPVAGTVTASYRDDLGTATLFPRPTIDANEPFKGTGEQNLKTALNNEWDFNQS